MPKKKEYNVGDNVTAFLFTSNGGKKKVKGKVKEIKKYYGSPNYTVTEGVVEDFTVRRLK